MGEGVLRRSDGGIQGAYQVLGRSSINRHGKDSWTGQDPHTDR